jgi:hypothetical protein
MVLRDGENLAQQISFVIRRAQFAGKIRFRDAII